MKPTPEQQRIAIAEAFGWSNIDPAFMVGRVPDRVPYCFWGNQHHEIPDYLNDLNAMHEAVAKCIGLDKADDWNKNLYIAVFKESEVTPDMLTDAELTYCINNATASQRAEAFLRTIGKWIED